MPSSVKPACGGCHERVSANPEDACVYLPPRKRNVASSAMPTESGYFATRLPLCRPETCPSHCGAKAMRRCGMCGPSTPCFCSRKSGRLRNIVPLLAGGMGILRSMPSRQVFPSSANSPVFFLLTSGHSLGAFPAPGGASMFCFVRHGERPSGLGFQQQISGAKNTLEICCRSLRRKHISALGAGHLTSLRAGVSRGSSGQKPTWRKSSWHSTKTPSA